MIKKIIFFYIGKIKCIKNGHIFSDSVSCPFTGKSYKGCTRCGEMITL